MKRIITFLLTGLLVLTLCACDQGRGSGASSASDLTMEEIQQILAEIEAQEAAQQ